MVLSFDPQIRADQPGPQAEVRKPVEDRRRPLPRRQRAVRGKVVSMTDYGAFVQLEEGIEGMVHVSEMSWTRRVRHPNEILGARPEVDVMILTVDPESEKIALGIKQTQPNPWKQLAERYPVNSDRRRARCATLRTTAPSSRLKKASTACST